MQNIDKAKIVFEKMAKDHAMHKYLKKSMKGKYIRKSIKEDNFKIKK